MEESFRGDSRLRNEQNSSIKIFDIFLQILNIFKNKFRLKNFLYIYHRRKRGETSMFSRGRDFLRVNLFIKIRYAFEEYAYP